jgi:endonuclease/exonuclease/phosphatase family metal-dependent hydrolase
MLCVLAGCRAPGNQQPDARAPDGGGPDVDARMIDAPGMIDAPPPTAGERLRLVTGNITSGNFQAYEDPGIRIFRGLAADIAMIQEFNYKTNSDGDLREFVERAFGPGYLFVRGVGQIPNGIVSRYPIDASGEWIDTEVSNRRFTWAQIDIPGETDLFAVSVHLLTSNPTERDSEARQLVDNLTALPGGMYVVLGGDFNTDVRGEPCIQTLSTVFATAAPYPVDQLGVDNTNATRSKPYDWVLVNSALDALETDVVVGLNRFANGMVADTRVYSPIGDLAPAMTTDSGASMMQHMAVVRDFRVPGSGGPADPPPVSQVFINEVLANEPGSDTAGEFVELVNGGNADTDLSGWTISDSVQVRHTFAPGTTLGAGRAVVVFGGSAGIPGGLGNAIAASSGLLGLTNDADTVTLTAPAATLDTVEYTSSDDGVSINRDPDGAASGVFVLHTALVSSPRSPGTRVDGSAY